VAREAVDPPLAPSSWRRRSSIRDNDVLFLAPVLRRRITYSSPDRGNGFSRAEKERSDARLSRYGSRIGIRHSQSARPAACVWKTHPDICTSARSFVSLSPFVGIVISSRKWCPYPGPRRSPYLSESTGIHVIYFTESTVHCTHMRARASFNLEPPLGRPVVSTGLGRM